MPTSCRPTGTGGALYIRPVMFGTTPQIGVGASLEYELIIMVVPVGAITRAASSRSTR